LSPARLKCVSSRNDFSNSVPNEDFDFVWDIGLPYSNPVSSLEKMRHRRNFFCDKSVARLDRVSAIFSPVPNDLIPMRLGWG